MFIVSACLLGENCKYNGENNRNEEVIKFLRDREYKKVCPEVLGGLNTPRIPAEIKKDKVISKSGEDFTEEFILGAKKTLEIAKKSNAKIAILKERSPSCGYRKIYDGSFNKKLIDGNGITAKLLLDNDIEILTEKDIEKIVG